MKKTIEVFISYSSKDTVLKDELETHLSILKEQNLISCWHDSKIKPGVEWERKIDEHLQSADIILLLVSPNFLASEHCKSEVNEAINRRESDNIHVIPIIIRPSDWKHTKLARLQAIPRTGIPITSNPDRDNAFLDIINEIRSILLIDRNYKKKKEWIMIIDCTIDEINKRKVEAIVEHLRKLSQDSTLTFLRKEPGSVILYFKSTLAGFHKISAFFKDGILVNQLKLNIESVKLRSEMQEAESEPKQGPFYDNHKEQEKILVISKATNEKASDRIIQALGDFSNSKRLNWDINKLETKSPLGEDILELTKKNKVLVYLHCEDSNEDAIDWPIAVKLEEILKKKKCVFVVFFMTDRPLPFGFPRGIPRIRGKRIVEDTQIIRLSEKIKSILEKDRLPVKTVWGATKQILKHKPLSLLSTSAKPLVVQCRNNPCLSHTALYLLDWIAYVSGMNEPKVWISTIEHAHKVLDYFIQLCGLPSDASSSISSFGKEYFPLLSANDCFAALFGILLHNQPLQRVVPGALYGEYVQNARKFLTRTRTLATEICKCVPSAPKNLIEDVFFIGIEIFKDSLYWREGVQDDKKTAEYHEKIRKRNSNKNHEKITIALRICDILDIGHRSVPDLVRDLFTSAQYPEGLKCFFNNTFHFDKDFLFTRPPSLVKQQLRLEWPAYQNVEHLEFIGKLREIVEGKVGKTLELLKSKIRHPNFAIQLFSEDAPDELDSNRLMHIIWSFFPLAIEYTPSDSVAARIAIKILPSLVDYIQAADKNPKGDYDFTYRHVEKLLHVFQRLRRNSHFLPRIVEIARESIREIPPNEYRSKIKIALENFFPQHDILHWLDLRWKSLSPNKTNARNFFVFGISQPVTGWITGLAQVIDEPITIIFLNCLRKLIVPGPAFKENIEVLSIAEHSVAKELLLIAISRQKVNKNKIVIEEEIWDFKRFAAQNFEENRTEVLFGARRLLVERNDPYVISNYGSNLLSSYAKNHGVTVRVITGEERFQDCLKSYKPIFAPDSFSISYSSVDQPNTEDEPVPLNQISFITTEKKDYDNIEASKLLLDNAKETEIEYAKLISEETNFNSITPDDIKSIFFELDDAIKEFERVNNQKLPKEILDKFEDLKKINNSGKNIETKLKLVLPIIPLLVYYEIEVNADSLMYKAWKRIKALAK